MSSLLTFLGQMVVACATLLVAALCVGLGQLVGARRPGVALVAGWGVGGLAVLMAGTLGGVPLPVALGAVGVAGAVGLVLVAQGSFEEESWVSAGRTLLLAVPFLGIACLVAPSGADAYSHWLPNLGYLYLHGHFPTLADRNSVSVHPAYPYGLAFIGLAVSLLVARLAETSGIVWNALLLVAFASLCADIIAGQIKLKRGSDYLRNPISEADFWGIAAVGLLASTMLSPFFVPSLFLSNDGDGAVAAVTGVVTASVMLWLASDVRTAPESRLLQMAAIGMCCTALVDIRQDSLTLFALLFIAAVAAVPLERQAGRTVRPVMLLLLLPAPLLLALVWREYQVFAIPENGFSVLPFALWHWAEIPSAFGRMMLVVVSRPGHFGLLLILLGVALSAINTPDIFTPMQRSGAVMATVLGLGKTLTLLVLYVVGNFSQEQAAGAEDFWRYSVQVGPAMVAGGVAMIPVRLWDWTKLTRITNIALPALAVLLPIAFESPLRVDQVSRSHIAYLRDVARDLAVMTKGAPRVTLVDAGMDPFDLDQLLPVRYELLVGLRRSLSVPVPAVEMVAGTPPAHMVVNGGAPVDMDEGLLPEHRRQDIAATMSAPYVWFDNGGKTVSDLAGIDLAPGASYLVALHDGRPEIVHRWAIPALR